MGARDQRFTKGETIHHNHYGEGEIIDVDFNVKGLYRVRFWRSGKSIERWISDDEL